VAAEVAEEGGEIGFEEAGGAADFEREWEVAVGDEALDGAA